MEAQNRFRVSSSFCKSPGRVLTDFLRNLAVINADDTQFRPLASIVSNPRFRCYIQKESTSDSLEKSNDTRLTLASL